MVLSTQRLPITGVLVSCAIPLLTDSQASNIHLGLTVNGINMEFSMVSIVALST